MIDLQHMMNPLGPSPKAVEAIRNNLTEIHKYTGPLKKLIEKIAKLNHVKEDQIMLSDGADGALTLIAQSIFKGKHVAIPQPCFHRYKDYPAYLGIDYTLINPKDSLFFDENRILQSKWDILLLASPNNPTGFEISEKFLLKTLDKFEFVILDETLLLSLTGKQGLIDKYSNLIIVRSFSKLYGLAGLRIGYIIGSAGDIGKIKSVSTPFKVNYLGQVAALAALDDRNYLQKSKKLIEQELLRLFRALKQESLGFSKTLCYCLSLTEKEILYLGKNFSFSNNFDFGITENNIFRFCVGLPEQNKRVIEILGSSQ